MNKSIKILSLINLIVAVCSCSPNKLNRPALKGEDLAYSDNALQEALEKYPSKASYYWKNPNTGNSGYITPSNIFVSKGKFCRSYLHEINIDGIKVKDSNTACKLQGKKWEVGDH